MVSSAFILLFSATLSVIVLCHPAREQLKLPQVNISNPYEINNLNYYNGDVDSDPGESKLFRRTVSNFEKSVNYIDKTVRQVEALINANSSLPRLTRGEILEIIENITQSDLEATKQNKTKERSQKAIMLVMPYTPQNADDEKMQELFTRRPVTKIIGEVPKISETEVKPTNKRRRRPLPQIPDGGAFLGEVFPEPLPERTTEKVPEKKATEYVKNQEKNSEKSVRQKQRPPVFTQKPLVNTPFATEKSTTPYAKYESEIITAKPFLEESSNENRKRRRGSTTPKPSAQISTEVSVNSNTQTNISIRRRRPTKAPQRHPNHKYPDETEPTVPKQGIKIVNSPKLRPELNTNSNIKPIEFSTKKQEVFTLPTSRPARPSQPHHFTTAKPLLSDINLPEDLKTALDDLELGDSVPKTPTKFSIPNEVKTGVLPNPPPLNDNIRELLASIGVLPSTSTTTAIPDISNVADTLSPDMKQLLMSFGLLPDPNHKTEEVNNKEAFAGTSTAEVHPDSYVQFKPLPDNGPTRDEMEEFLGRFGLGRNSKYPRSQKALGVKQPEKTLSEVPRIQDGMLPDSMKDVLSDLGLANRDSKKDRTGSAQKTLDKENNSAEKTTEKQHVFNPMEQQYATQNELEKLNQLLDIIKQLEKLNGTAREENLSKVDLKNIKDLVGSFNKDEFVPLDEQDKGPNPLNYDYGVSKNEVKRQQNLSASVSVAFEVSTAAPPSTISTTTTTEENTPNIKDLEDSFGGPSDTKVEATIPPPTTKAPNTGFYYLLDWNTFLDIDDQKGKRVNLRFQPKAGDPSKFISVTVP